MILAFAFSGALTSLSAEWSHVNTYSVTIEASEHLGARSQRQVLRYSYRRPDRARIEVVDGAGRGGVVLWYGDDRATAYRRGLKLLKLRVGAEDGRVTSLRGNGVLTPNFDAILSCFVENRSRVSESPGPILDGAPTIAITLANGGLHCAGDSATDRGVTRDVLYVSRKTSLPVQRERYVGAELVERWELRDLRLNPGLTDSAFR
jgi:outer membrane lipoprotein-sorting protein